MKKQELKRKVHVCDELKVAITREVRETLAVLDHKEKHTITPAQLWNIRKGWRGIVVR